MSVCPAGRRPHGYPGKHVWNGGCLSEILRLGPAGPLAGGQSHRAGCLGWDTEQRGGAQSWPGTTWGSKKT